MKNNTTSQRLQHSMCSLWQDFKNLLQQIVHNPFKRRIFYTLMLYYYYCYSSSLVFCPLEGPLHLIICLFFFPSLLFWRNVAWDPRDTHGVYRPWYSPQLLPIEGAHGTNNPFLALVPYFLGDSFSEVGRLVLSQLTITIAVYDLHRCTGLILSAPM